MDAERIRMEERLAHEEATLEAKRLSESLASKEALLETMKYATRIDRGGADSNVTFVGRNTSGRWQSCKRTIRR